MVDGKTIEKMCRDMCVIDGVDPDKTCYGLGILMEAGSEYPAWHVNIKRVKCVMDSLGIPYHDDWWNN